MTAHPITRFSAACAELGTRGACDRRGLSSPCHPHQQLCRFADGLRRGGADRPHLVRAAPRRRRTRRRSRRVRAVPERTRPSSDPPPGQLAHARPSAGGDRVGSRVADRRELSARGGDHHRCPPAEGQLVARIGSARLARRPPARIARCRARGAGAPASANLGRGFRAAGRCSSSSVSWHASFANRTRSP